MYALRLLVGLLASTLPSVAGITVFAGFDPAAGPGDPHPQSTIAATQFAATVTPLSKEPLSINSWDAFPSGLGGGYGWDGGKNLLFLTPGTFQSEVTGVSGTAEAGFNISATGAKFNRITPQSGNTTAGLVFSSDDEPAAGFGMYLTGYGGADDSLLFSIDDEEPREFLLVSPLQAGVLFVGFTSDRYFHWVTFEWANAAGLSDTFAIDDVTWASSPIPEPARLGFVAGGVAILGAVVANRRRCRWAGGVRG